MKPHLIVRLGLVCLLTILAVSAAAADPSTAGPDQIGSKATASWTETTEKAATTAEQKKILASGKVATITGELVEVSCYLQLGKRGEAHAACGSDCIKQEHDPRRYGEIDVRDKLASLVAKQVSATGMLTTKDGRRPRAIRCSDFWTPRGCGARVEAGLRESHACATRSHPIAARSSR